MRGAFVILIAMVVIGVVLYLADVLYYRRRRSSVIESDAGSGNGIQDSPAADEPSDSEEESGEDEGICCGMHTVCEKTNLSPLTGDIVYYDDEELDRFRGRDPESYSAEETEEFRDVLLTLLPEDVAGWSRSIQVREIALPVDVRDELLLIVGELRQKM